MRVVTSSQIRELDRRAMDEAGIPGVVLMENAGRAVVEHLEREYGPLQGRRAALFCGAGNNGGDGFVILRLLLLAGAGVSLFTTIPDLAEATLKRDAATHLNVIRAAALNCLAPMPRSDAERSRLALERYDFAIDALLGTGIKDAPRGDYADAIRAINALPCAVVAVDVPSGVDADTGAVPGEAVRAAGTVTFAFPKPGLLLFPGAELAGRVAVSDIGFPWLNLSPPGDLKVLTGRISAHHSRFACSQSVWEADGWEPLLQKRSPETNKGDYGHVAIAAGSRGMAGAPALVARAAQRAGAGLVTVFAPQSAQSVLAVKLDEQMTSPLPEVEGSASEAGFDLLATFAQKASVLCIGPGLTTHESTVRLVHRLVRELTLPMVLDADGLNALAMRPDIGAERAAGAHGPLILTPHPGEAARLLNSSIPEVQADRIGAVRELARRFQAVAVLKGRYTLIADPDGQVRVNITGNPGMATGGMGDTLTGIVGALVGINAAQARRSGREPVPMADAVSLAVLVHGIAGDLAAAARGEAGLTAGDVIDHLPEALATLTPAV